MEGREGSHEESRQLQPRDHHILAAFATIFVAVSSLY